MLRYFPVVVIFLSACNGGKPAEEEFPVEEASNWITYEGRIPMNDQENLYLEISMQSSGAGEGSYFLKEWLERQTGTEQVGSFHGEYSTFSTPDGNIEIHF